MKSPLLDLAISAVRAWTRLYTRGMPTALREDRRAEIESDLWESRRDPSAERGIRAAAHVFVRLLRGVPADLVWRAEHRASRMPSSRRNIALAAIGVCVVALGMFAAVRPSELPVPRVAPTPIVDVSLRPPPPPPPPPP